MCTHLGGFKKALHPVRGSYTKDSLQHDFLFMKLHTALNPGNKKQSEGSWGQVG